MYFTNHDNGQLNAVYNGRFAFVPGAGPEYVQAALDHFKLQADSDRDQRPIPTGRRSLQAAVAEELLHSRLFLETRAGLLLVGLRWFARLSWAMLGNAAAVDWYYRLRAIYFVHSYTKKERAVAALDRTANLLRLAAKRTLTREEMGEAGPLLEALDRDVFEAWKIHCSARARLLLWAAGPILRWMGRQAALYPTFITQQPTGHSELRERNVSLGGFVNTAASSGNTEATWAERIAGFFSVERWAVNRARDDWRWTIIKFRAERAVWPLWDQARRAEIESGAEPRPWPGFEEYVEEMAQFVAYWSHVEKMDWFLELADAILELAQSSSEKGLTLWRRRLGLDVDARKAKAINFFFLHGN